MGKRRKKQSIETSINPYERCRLLRLQETKATQSGTKDIVKPLTSLVNNGKSKKGKKRLKPTHNEEDGDNVIDLDLSSDELPEESETFAGTSKKITKERLQSHQYVQPLMIKKHAMSASEQRRGVNDQHGRNKAHTVAHLSSKNMRLHNQLFEEVSQENSSPLGFSTPNQLLSKEKHALIPVKKGGANKSNVYGPTIADESGAEGEIEGECGTEGSDKFDDSDKDGHDILNGFDEKSGSESRYNELETEESNRRGRGPTKMQKVHMRPFEKREAIILNEFGEAIGPVTPKKDTLGELSRFLGTIARDYGYAPLVHKTWLEVPNKEKMWEYVLTKYIVPKEGKKWVLKAIGGAWRVYKCRFKKKYFFNYSDNKTRWKNRPKSVPDDDFKLLLTTWNKKKEQERSSSNRMRRMSQINMQNDGPKLNSKIQEEMNNEDPNKKPISPTQRTRTRSENKKYGDKAKKTEAIKNDKPPEDGGGVKNAHLGVMGKEYDGCRRLRDKVVPNKVLKNPSPSTYVDNVLQDVMDSLRAEGDTEKTQIVDMRKELEEEYEKRKAELEAEHARKMEELQGAAIELGKQKESMVEEVLEKLISKLPPSVVKQFLT